MAFNKKTWVDRVVEYPLRRLLTIIRPDEGSGTMVTDIQREEGTITTAGDAFSAANMNDLEDRIESAFNDAGGGAFVGVKYHASLVDFPGYPCWEDLTTAQKEKFDINNGATVNFLDDEAPSDIIGDTDISSIADGTLTGAVAEHETEINQIKSDVSDMGDVVLLAQTTTANSSVAVTFPDISNYRYLLIKPGVDISIMSPTMVPIKALTVGEAINCYYEASSAGYFVRATFTYSSTTSGSLYLTKGSYSSAYVKVYAVK